jgi:hypothetical protein
MRYLIKIQERSKRPAKPFGAFLFLQLCGKCSNASASLRNGDARRKPFFHRQAFPNENMLGNACIMRTSGNILFREVLGNISPLFLVRKHNGKNETGRANLVTGRSAVSLA